MTRRPLETVGSIIEHYLRVALERGGLARLNPEIERDVSDVKALLTEAEEANAVLTDRVALLESKVAALEESVVLRPDERKGK